MAWLNTAPDAPAVKGVKQPKLPVRIKRMKADGVEIDLPENPLPHMIEWLMEAGPVSAGSMGAAPIGWTEIAAWQALTGIALNPWEARTLRRLSGDFHDQMHKARDINCPPPFARTTRNDEAVTRQFEEMFRRMTANRKTVGKRGNNEIRQV